MPLSDLLPTIQASPRSEKLRLIELVAADMAREEQALVEMTDKTVPIWSPYDAFDGAATSLRVLEEERAGV